MVNETMTLLQRRELRYSRDAAKNSAIETDEDIALSELQFVRERIAEEEENEAAWNYLVALTEGDFRNLIEPEDPQREPKILWTS